MVDVILQLSSCSLYFNTMEKYCEIHVKWDSWIVSINVQAMDLTWVHKCVPLAEDGYLGETYRQ